MAEIEVIGDRIYYHGCLVAVMEPSAVPSKRAEFEKMICDIEGYIEDAVDCALDDLGEEL